MKRLTVLKIFLAGLLGFINPIETIPGLVSVARAQTLEQVTYNEFLDPRIINKQLVVKTTKGDIHLDLVSYLCKTEEGKKAWESYLNGIWLGNFCNLPLRFPSGEAWFSYSSDETPYRIKLPAVADNWVDPGDLVPGEFSGGVSTCRLRLILTRQRVTTYAMAVSTFRWRGQNNSVIQSLSPDDSVLGFEILKPKETPATSNTQENISSDNQTNPEQITGGSGQGPQSDNNYGTNNPTSQQEQKIYPMYTWAPYKGLEFMVTDAGGCLTDNYELARAYRVDRGLSRREYEEKCGNMDRGFDAVRLRVRSATPGTKHIDLLNIASLGNGPSTAFTSGFIDPPLEAYYDLLNGYRSPHEFDVGYNTYVERVIPFPGQSNSVMYLNLDNTSGMGGANIECGIFWEFRNDNGLRIIPAKLIQR